jgi:hypothetical protein
MAVKRYSIVAHDWVNLEFIINDLTHRVVGQELGSTSSPEFAGLTLTGFDGIVTAESGILSASNILDLGTSE